MATNIEERSERQVVEVEGSGAAAEAVGGLGVIVLAILGLVGLAPDFLCAIAGIVFGVAVLAQGAAVAAEYYTLMSRITGGAMNAMELRGGMTVEIMGGVAAIVLGILSLLGIAEPILMPALIIAGGASLLLGAGTVQRLNNVKVAAVAPSERGQGVVHGMTSGAAAGQMLAGVAAIVLGIIALASMPSSAGAASSPAAWLTLALVGLLVLGSSLLMSGGSLTWRLIQIFGHMPKH